MKKLLLAIMFFAIALPVMGQRYVGYQRWGKYTDAQMNAIDTSNSDEVYKVYNTTQGKWKCNDGGAGWVDCDSGGGTDNQQISDFSITSNILTLTLENGGTETVDLSSYLDNENVASGVISGTDLVLTLTDATTVTIDMSSFSGGTDNQTAEEVPYPYNGQTTAKDALDDLYTNKATISYVNASDIDTDGITKTADFTLSDTDIQAGVINIQTNDSVVMSVNKASLTERGFVKAIVEGTGFLAVEGTDNGDYKSQSGEGETLGIRIKSNGDVIVLDPSDLLAYTPVTGEVLGTELWTFASAGNSNNNADSTDGFQALSSSSTDLASVSDGSGGFIIQASAVDGNSDYIRITAFLSGGSVGLLTDGATYKMTIRARYTTLNSGQASISDWDGLDSQITDIVLTNTLTPYDIYFTPNSANGILYPKIYMSDAFNGAGAIGNEIQVIIDSVKEVL